MPWDHEAQLRNPHGYSNHISVEPTLHDQIVMAQVHDKGIQIMKEELAKGKKKYQCFRVDWQVVVWFGDRIVVSQNVELRKKI